jgi:exosortase O
VPRRHAATGPLLIAALLAANIAYAPPTVVAAATAAAAPKYSFPAELQVAPVALRAGELDWLYKDGATSVERVRFSFEGISGSLILVESTTWRAHHNPERCFENYGLRKESENVVLIDPDHSARVLRLARGASGATHGAMYWFQSKDTRTDDYGTRLWSAFSLSAPNYVLVSVLFDASLPPDHPALYRLARVLRQSVDTRLMAHPQTSP